MSEAPSGKSIGSGMAPGMLFATNTDAMPSMAARPAPHDGSGLLSGQLVGWQLVCVCVCVCVCVLHAWCITGACAKQAAKLYRHTQPGTAGRRTC
jgi:hypothetical protein